MCIILTISSQRKGSLGPGGYVFNFMHEAHSLILLMNNRISVYAAHVWLSKSSTFRPNLRKQMKLERIKKKKNSLAICHPWLLLFETLLKNTDYTDLSFRNSKLKHTLIRARRHKIKHNKGLLWPMNLPSVPALVWTKA